MDNDIFRVAPRQMRHSVEKMCNHLICASCGRLSRPPAAPFTNAEILLTQSAAVSQASFRNVKGWTRCKRLRKERNCTDLRKPKLLKLFASRPMRDPLRESYGP